MSERTYRPDDPTNPTHYRADGERECIDVLRDGLGDHGFVAFCLGNAAKYLHRAGRKGAAEVCMGKAEWYLQMAAHVVKPDLVRDPRDGTAESWFIAAALSRPAFPGLPTIDWEALR